MEKSVLISVLISITENILGLDIASIIVSVVSIASIENFYCVSFEITSLHFKFFMRFICCIFGDRPSYG